jgi:hypothetical protein
MELFNRLFEAFESSELVAFRGRNIFLPCPILHLSEWMNFEPVCNYAGSDLRESGKKRIVFWFYRKVCG